MKKLILICSLALSSLSFGQQGTIEVGSDINFWVSSTGGSFNLAPRLGYEVVDNLSVGPLCVLSIIGVTFTVSKQNQIFLVLAVLPIIVL